MFLDDKAEFSDNVKMTLKKVLDIIQEYSAHPLRIIIYTPKKDSPLINDRINLIKDFLVKNLPILESDINISAKSDKKRGNITAFSIGLK